MNNKKACLITKVGRRFSSNFVDLYYHFATYMLKTRTYLFIIFTKIVSIGIDVERKWVSDKGTYYRFTCYIFLDRYYLLNI